jgi:N-acetyl-gamma-glutamylphosphate reductase
MMFGEVNESVKAYGVGGHRHVAEIEQELAWLGATAAVDNPGAAGVDFLPHLIPMTRASSRPATSGRRARSTRRSSTPSTPRRTTTSRS